MKRILVLAVFFLVSSAGQLFATDLATKDECEIKVAEAVAMAQEAGLDATYAKIQEEGSPFVWKDSYVYAVNMDTGVVVAHPNAKLVGKNLRAVKDVTGKMFIMEYTALAKEKGEGWTTFMWPKLNEKKPSKKNNYVKAVPGQNVLFGAGTYQ